MNNTFQWNRFCNVVYKDLRHLWPTFGTTMLVLALVPVALWFFGVAFRVDVPVDVRIIVLIVDVWLAGIMAPSRLYRTINLRNEGIYFAMLPASKGEKFASMLLYTIIICPLIVLIALMLVDTLLAILPFGPFAELMPLYAITGFIGAASNMEIGGWLWVIVILGWIFDVLMFVFTATLFTKHKVLQTLLWTYAIEFLLSILFIPISLALVGNTSFMEHMHDWAVSLEGVHPTVIANWVLGVIVALQALGSALFGWLAWRRLDRMGY